MNVVICTYNRKIVFDTLRNFLSFESNIRDQIKLIVVDNYGLPDLNRFCKVNSIEYILESKAGLSIARNRALELTKNQWIYFVDDDVFFTDKLLDSLNSQRFDSKAILFSEVLPSRELKINNEKLDINIIASLSVHYEEIYPIGCSFGFYNDKNYRFDENLGRKGRELSGGEENDLINRMIINDTRNLEKIEGSIIHRIENKLNQEYVNEFFYNELKENPKRKITVYLGKVILYSFLQKKKILRTALIYSLIKFLKYDKFRQTGIK